jgi:hypothetical protein
MPHSTVGQKRRTGAIFLVRRAHTVVVCGVVFTLAMRFSALGKQQRKHGKYDTNAYGNKIFIKVFRSEM